MPVLIRSGLNLKVFMEKKIGAINGLRGFAILAVIYQHVFSKYTPSGLMVNHFPAGLKLYPLALLSNGWFGVQLFFMLSGFVLYLPYARERRRMSAFTDTVVYYKRRASRLLPLYYIAFVVAVLLWNINLDANFMRHFILMMTVTFNFTQDFYTPWYNSDLWSIGLEILFSVLFPLFVLLARRIGAGRLFFVVAFISLAVRVVGAYMPQFEIPGSSLSVIRDSIAGRMDDFALGMFICGLYVNGVKFTDFAKPWLLVIVGFCFLFIGANMWDSIALGRAGIIIAPFTNSVNQAGFFLIICAALSVDAGALNFMVTNRFMQVLGMMSYSLYIWNHFVLRLVTRTGLIFAKAEAYPYSVFTLS
ncbi:acyltransferase, partial [bacterium]